MKEFDKSILVNGKNIYLKVATPEDAAFVLDMRSNQKKTMFLHRVIGGIEEQRQWLKRCYDDPYQIYFVIMSKANEQLGLVRIYDQKEDSFCWGSWLIKEGAPSYAAIESALLIYKYALNIMGFKKSHFDVRIGNDKVIDFHKRFGAIEVGRDHQDIFFEISNQAICDSLTKFQKYLPIET